MPVQRGEDESGPFYRWGSRGRRYRYERGDESSRQRARSRALLAGRRQQGRNPTRSTPARPEERRRGSRRNPEGSAAGTRGGIEISPEVEVSLRRKVEAHNADSRAESRMVDLGMLKAVYRRGAGAFSATHGRGMTRGQWAMARVNAFLHIVRAGQARRGGRLFDQDLLPLGHPRSTRQPPRRR